MNELCLYLPDDDGSHDGYTRVGGPVHPFHARFNPGPGIGLGYEDLKVIELHQFLKSVANGVQGVPGFAEALAVANYKRQLNNLGKQSVGKTYFKPNSDPSEVSFRRVSIVQMHAP